MAELNPTAATLLGFLHAGEASGYGLVSVAEQTTGGFWTLTRSQVYRELAALADRGLVTAGDTGPRSRVPYRITEAGRAAFSRWITEPPELEHIRFPLLVTVAFGAHLDRGTLLGHIERHRAVHAERLAAYRARMDAGGLDPYQSATLDFGIRHEEAVLAWMEALPATLEAGGTPPAPPAPPSQAAAPPPGTPPTRTSPASTPPADTPPSRRPPARRR